MLLVTKQRHAGQVTRLEEVEKNTEGIIMAVIFAVMKVERIKKYLLASFPNFSCILFRMWISRNTGRVLSLRNRNSAKSILTFHLIQTV